MPTTAPEYQIKREETPQLSMAKRQAHRVRRAFGWEIIAEYIVFTVF